MHKTELALLAALAFPIAALAQAPKELPAGWQSRLQSGGSDSSPQIWRTPTGWHVSTTDAGFWWDSTMVGKKGFSVILDVSLSPESAGNVFGMFVGGRDLHSNRLSYVSFTIKADGNYRLEIKYQGQSQNRMPWAQHRAITMAIGDEPTKYRVRLDVHPLRLDFVVNDIKMHSINRSTVRADGIVGLWLGSGLNMDITDFRIEPIP